MVHRGRLTIPDRTVGILQSLAQMHRLLLSVVAAAVVALILTPRVALVVLVGVVALKAGLETAAPVLLGKAIMVLSDLKPASKVAAAVAQELLQRQQTAVRVPRLPSRVLPSLMQGVVLVAPPLE